MNDRKSYLCKCYLHIAGFLVWITESSGFKTAFFTLAAVSSLWTGLEGWFLVVICSFIPEKLQCLLRLLTLKNGQGRELRMRKLFLKIIPTNSMKVLSCTSVLKYPPELCCHACQIFRHLSVICRDVHLHIAHLYVRLPGDLASLKPCY